MSSDSPTSVRRVIEFTISKPGKLGIEFRQMASPYYVIRVSDEAQALYDVIPGDLLTDVKKESDSEWTKTEGLSWADLVEVLKQRPAKCRFMRIEVKIPVVIPPVLPIAPRIAGSSPVSVERISPVRGMTPRDLPLSSSPRETRVVTTPSMHAGGQGTPIGANSPGDTSPSSLLTVVYSTEGPLGLEFEDKGHPFQVGGVKAGSISAEKGVWKGDYLVTINGADTSDMSWDAVRTELTVRPAVVVYRRTAESVAPGGGVWGFASGLVEQMVVPSDSAVRLAETEKQLAASITEKERILTALSEERIKSNKLMEVIAEIERGQEEIVHRFQLEVADRDKRIRELDEREPVVHVDNTPLLEEVSLLTEHVVALESDNLRLRKEASDLGSMVTQCLAKIQADLSDKPHWVDRRVVCSAIATFLREMDQQDADDSQARQRLGDVLGLTFEERTAMGLLGPSKNPDLSPSIGSAFVSFLERESAASPATNSI